MDILYLFYEDRLVGSITRKMPSGISFAYDPQWKKTGFPVSLSMPFSLDEPSLSHFAESFFWNIIPEGPGLPLLSKRVKVDVSDLFGILKAYGKDCPGTFHVQDNPTAPLAESMRGLIDITDKLDSYIRNLPKGRSPRLQSGLGLQQVLSGAQDKISCFVQNGRFYIPTAESAILPTHIIKPSWSYAANEYFCTKMADRLGLPVPAVDMAEIGGFLHLVSERYDRQGGKRLHQEDFCQILGKQPWQKYQSASGGIGFKDMAQACDEYLGFREKSDIVKVALFNMMIGNGDAHGRNFSVLRNLDGSLSLAPFYDLASSTVEDLDDAFAMFIGNAGQFNELEPSDFSMFATDMDIESKDLANIMRDFCIAAREGLSNTFVMNEREKFPEQSDTFLRIVGVAEDRLTILEELTDAFRENLQNYPGCS